MREAEERHAAQETEAKRWLQLIAAGTAVQQAGWWSVFGDLGLGLGLLGGAVVLVGAKGFDKAVADHPTVLDTDSASWRAADVVG